MMPTLHLEHPERPRRALCGATSGRIVTAAVWMDNREGKPCQDCGPKRSRKTGKKR